MAATVLSDIPDQITAGDSISWRRSLPNYPAGAGWVLSYVLVMADEQITITAAAEGAAHVVALTAPGTAAWAAGQYSYQAYVTLAASSLRLTVDVGMVEVLPDFAAQTAGYDARPHCFVVRDALRATVEGRATESQTSIAVGGRQISEMGHAELMAALEGATAKCNIWAMKNRRRKGRATGQTVKVRL